MKKMSKNNFFWDFFLDFYIDPGGPGGHLGGSRTDSEAQKLWKNEIFKDRLRSIQITPYLGDPKFDKKKNEFCMNEAPQKNKRKNCFKQKSIFIKSKNRPNRAFKPINRWWHTHKYGVELNSTTYVWVCQPWFIGLNDRLAQFFDFWKTRFLWKVIWS